MLIKPMKFYIYSEVNASGINVLYESFERSCKKWGVECERIGSLAGLSPSDWVIPFGIKEAYEVMQAGLSVNLAFLVDAYTLGLKNKLLFYLRRGHIFHYDFFYSVYAYFKYLRRERIVLKAYRKLALVSEHDIRYLQQLVSDSKAAFICVQNGANFEDSVLPRTVSDHFRLGILSPWGTKMTSEESVWFVKDWFPRFARKHADVKLYIAGRGPFIERMRGIPNVEILGAVDSLNEFFSHLDAFIAVNPKGCGVLNRALDAMAHKTPVAALPASMTGFPEIEGNYMPFSDPDSFEKKILYMREHPDEMQTMAERAYDMLCRNNNWEQNYDAFVQEAINAFE